MRKLGYLPLFFLLLTLSLGLAFTSAHAQTATPQTLIFHVCDSESGNMPNATATYEQLLSLDKGDFSIFFEPEYYGNVNFTDTLSWLSTADFGGQAGVPIALDVFGGGSGDTPQTMLSTANITAAMAVANVQWLFISEMYSYYQGIGQTLPTDYIQSILSFAYSHGLHVFWTEWDTDAYPAIESCIGNYASIVTVSFSTNSALAPADGYQLVSGDFQNWGASVQAWYWPTRYPGTTVMNMPISLLIQHAELAESDGAAVLEFEPYWYLFDNTGSLNTNGLQLMNALNSQTAPQNTSAPGGKWYDNPEIVVIVVVIIVMCVGLVKSLMK